MNTILAFILLLICSFQVCSQCIIKNSGQITLDKGTAVVCLHVKLNGVYNSTYAFRVNVDYFQALVVKDFASFINTQIKSGTNAVSVQVQFQNSENSQIKQIQLYNKGGKRFRDILSFIIIANQGTFNQISVDNEKCNTLGSGSVCHNDEGFTQTPADGSFAGKDPRFYVSWMGSDIKGNHFISHTRRLSRFSSFSVGSIYNDAKNVVSS